MSIFNQKPLQLFLSAISVIVLGLAVEHIYRTYGPEPRAEPIHADPITGNILPGEAPEDWRQRIEFVSKIPRVENQIIRDIESMVKSIEAETPSPSDSLPQCNSLSQSASKVTRCKGKYTNEFTEYVGEMFDKLAYGHGMMTYKPRGLKNIGEFKNGLEDGHVIVKDDQGRVHYIGEKRNGLRNGSGALYLPDTFPTQSYIGQFSENEIHGYGKYDYGDRIYEGSFHNGLRHGQGEETWKNGNIKYVGNWAYDLRDGSGILFRQGDIYEGNFKDHLEDGYGVYTYRSGDKITGYFKLGLRHGQSSYYFKSGDIEECDNYYYDLANGNCTYRWDSGEYIKSVYVKGVLNGPQTEQVNGEIVTRHYKDNLVHGEEVRIFTNGDKRITNYKMGMRHGLQSYIFSYGEKHEKNFVNNKQDGISRFYYTSGDIEECDFDMGEPLGCELK